MPRHAHQARPSSHSRISLTPRTSPVSSRSSRSSLSSHALQSSPSSQSPQSPLRRFARHSRPTGRPAALTVLVAPSGFKESLDAREVADEIAAGVLEACPDAAVIKAPLVDGGEGFTRAVVEATGGELRPVRVTGPVGQAVDAWVGLLGPAQAPGGTGGHPAPLTAVIEIAAAAGLRLVPADRRNPMQTTSRGVGELIRAALDLGARRILVGCGDSGVNDGGAGMAQALGARLVDGQGRELGSGGGELARLARIDLDALDPRLATVEIEAAVNWHNDLLGPRGVARVFGPQKGATPAQVLALEAALANYAVRLGADAGFDLSRTPGAGASGGLGAGLTGLLGATLKPRFEIIRRYFDLEALIARADLVITAEGSLDAQTPHGKVPAEVARLAKLRGLPVIALAGRLGDGVACNLTHGIDAFASIQPRPCTVEESIAHAGRWLKSAAGDAMRLLQVGWRLARPDPIG